MTVKKTVATLVAGAVLAGSAVLAMATSASAVPQGPLQPGKVFWFNTAGPLESQTAATQISSGANAANRPWSTLAVDAACPAGSAQMQPFVRIPQAGPEDDWNQVSMGESTTTADSQGRFWTAGTAQADRLSKPEVIAYNVANGGTGQFPLILACLDNGGVPTGYFRTVMTISGTTAATLAWSIPREALPQAASTTTLAASASTVEAGTSVDLTATVDPSTATGDVEFFAGTTSLGTATLAGGVATLSTSALPVGTNAVTAQYLGGSNAASTSAPVSVQVTAVAARATTTTLAVTPVSGAAYSAVTFTTTVTATTGAANGTVTFRDGSTSLGSVPVVGGVVADFTTNVLGAGAHSLTASFVGTAPYSDSASAPVSASYDLAGAVDEQTVTVDIPVGAISITTPYTPASPLALGTAVLDPADSTYSASAPFEDIVITDTRSGNLGFTASVVSGAFTTTGGGSFPGLHAGLTGLAADQVSGNALLAGDVVLTDHAPFTDGLATPKVFASYAAGKALGTAHLEGTFGIDQVPTSVVPGLYTATVTFTAV